MVRQWTFKRAITLLEVILAMALFFAAAAALSQLLLIGGRSARWAELVSDGTLRCESKLAEYAGRMVPLQSQSPAPFDDDSAWEYEVEVAPTGVPSLLRVTVTVRHFRDQEHAEPDAEVSLARLVADVAEPKPAVESDLATDMLSVTPESLTIEQMLGLTGERL